MKTDLEHGLFRLFPRGVPERLLFQAPPEERVAEAAPQYVVTFVVPSTSSQEDIAFLSDIVRKGMKLSLDQASVVAVDQAQEGPLVAISLQAAVAGAFDSVKGTREYDSSLVIRMGIDSEPAPFETKGTQDVLCTQAPSVLRSDTSQKKVFWVQLKNRLKQEFV